MKESILNNYQEKPEKEKMRYFDLQTEIIDPIVENGKRTVRKFLAASNEEEAKERMKLLLMNDFSLDKDEAEESEIEAREINEAEYWRTTTKIKKSAESAHR